MHPTNDLCKIEVDSDEFGFGSDQSKAESGILVELPEVLPFFGFHSFAFEDSYADMTGANGEILKYYQDLIGKRVYWKGLSERGMVLKAEKTWAFIKLTDLIAWSEPGMEATLVISGEFRA